MYGETERSIFPRLVLAAGNFLAVLVAFWLYFLGGIEIVSGILGLDWVVGELNRRIILFSCSSVYFLRVLSTGFILLRRKMDFGEVAIIVVWVTIINILFAMLCGTSDKPLGMLDLIGGFLYIGGSVLNSGSEAARKFWKDDPANKGRLYTGGLFRYSMHINYFGDFVLFTGFALLTASIYSLIVPLVMFLLFTTVNIPMLDAYLAKKYGDEFEEYRTKTKKFVPFVY
ncbi:MAG: DUF1295 domain-containing protein [Pyrinomonadaceae bacterium]